ncbi:zinc finger MYM-type protein 1-like [Melanaphis sacchari]|uniref:zinc finger MYM-type protein 1-like n=1 Tax=Melanaphis sacchari TaxID=742174 RepID=UPI000DC1463A|nr:zinc finger MYM-type protein 1-like [Melanaphis sacchari]
MSFQNDEEYCPCGRLKAKFNNSFFSNKSSLLGSGSSSSISISNNVEKIDIALVHNANASNNESVLSDDEVELDNQYNIEQTYKEHISMEIIASNSISDVEQIAMVGVDNTNISNNVSVLPDDLVKLNNQCNIEQTCKEHISMVMGASSNSISDNAVEQIAMAVVDNAKASDNVSILPGDTVEFEHTIIDPKDPSIDPPKNRFEFKNRIICGPYQPIITFPRTLSGNQYRGFLSRYYNNYKWIEYSPIKDAAFCFPCRMFKGNSLNNSQLDHAFSIRGFRHWKNATTAFNNHQNSKAHNYSTISMSKFLDGNPIDVIIDENKKLELSQRECERLKNRDFFKRLIDITILLAKSGKPFRGHDESINSFNQGMFKEISKLLIKYDPIFKNHMDSSPRNALYSSNRIQNDIIMALYNYFKRKLALLLQNKKISIIADETSDVGHHQQMSIVIRYFDSILNKPVEHFVCLQRLTTVDAQSIFNSLNYVLVNKLSLNWSSVVGVCFDGAATMSGFNNRVQAKCKAKNNSIMYIHCYAHCLNLVLVDSVGRKNRVVFDFFGTVQLIFAFIESSCVRHAILEKIAKQINVKLVTLKSISNTRWACRSEAISAIKFNYSALVKALQEICDSIRLSDVSAKARGLIFQMKSFNFIFALNMLEPIFSVILKVSTNL